MSMINKTFSLDSEESNGQKKYFKTNSRFESIRAEISNIANRQPLYFTSFVTLCFLLNILERPQCFAQMLT